jgi:hypothetical protein
VTALLHIGAIVRSKQQDNQESEDGEQDSEDDNSEDDSGFATDLQQWLWCLVFSDIYLRAALQKLYQLSILETES